MNDFNLLETPHYVGKSFFLIGESLPHCYNCDYCRLHDGSGQDVKIDILPGEINPLFKNTPVAVNIFYGDPCLQWLSTLYYLKRLKEAKHTGLVILITKGLLNIEKIKQLNQYNHDLNLNVLISTIGKDSPINGTKFSYVTKNLELLNKYYSGKFSIEFRPIIHGINDDLETIEKVIKLAKKYNIPIGYSGLQAKTEALEKINKKLGYDIKQFKGEEFHTLKKILPSSLRSDILTLSKKHDVKVFHKTACLLSYHNGFERDFNAHYYRPNEMFCKDCPMLRKCEHFKHNLPTEGTFEFLPYEHKIVKTEEYTCNLLKMGICQRASEDCKKISGSIIRTNTPLTTTDLRLTKWITGMTVDTPNLIEVPYMSHFWSV